MFETAGTLTIVELVSSLVALVLLPLAWAMLCGIAAVRRSQGRIALRVAIAGAGGTLGLAVAHAVRASQLPQGRVGQQHVAHLARVGQLDLSIDLVRDPTSAAYAVLVAFIAFVAVLHAVWTTTHGLAARLAWTGLAASASLLVVMSDGLPVLAVGLQMATLAAWALGGGGRGRALGLALAGDVAFLFAIWILFWSLGGSFGASGYTPDPHPRFAIVALTDPPRADGKATVTLTTYEDALVTSDDGPPLPGEPIRSPFILNLEPGTYSFRIQAGAAATELLVTHVTLAAGRAYVLSPYGPTTSLRNLDDQLAVARPTPNGPTAIRTVLASRSIAGIPVTSVVGFIAILAALLRLGLLATSDRGGIAYVLEAVPPVVISLHVAPLMDPSAAAAIAVLSAVAAAVIAAAAAASRSRDRVPRAALGALVAVAVTAVLLGESAAAVVLLVAAMLGAAAATAALESRADVRWLGVACAALSGILPGAGVSPGIASAITGAFGASLAGRWAGAVVAPLVTIAAILVALAVFHVYGASITKAVPGSGGAPARTGTAASNALVVTLAAFAVLGGAALGTGTSPFGGHTAPLARRLVGGGGGLDASPRIALAALGLSVAASIIGLVAARRASRTAEAPSWLRLLGAPAALLGSIAGAAGSLLAFFVRSVVIMNEDVIDDATELLSGVFGAIGAGFRRIDTVVAGGLFARLLGRSADQDAVVLTGMGDRAGGEGYDRVRTGLVLGMVAVLGLVVLSSVVLG